MFTGTHLLYDLVQMQYNVLFLISNSNFQFGTLIYILEYFLYGLSRTRYLQLTNMIFLGSTFFLMVIINLPQTSTISGSENILYTLFIINILVIIYTGLFLPAKDTILATIGELGILDFFSFLYPKSSFSLNQQTIFSFVVLPIIVAMLTMSTTYLRNKYFYELQTQQRSLSESEKRYRQLFEDSHISLWMLDLTQVKNILDQLHKSGIKDLGTYLLTKPEILQACASTIRLVNLNQASLDLFKAKTKEEFLKNITNIFDITRDLPGIFSILFAGAYEYEIETPVHTINRDTLYVNIKWTIIHGYEKSFSRILVSITDLTEQKRVEKILRQINHELEQKNSFITMLVDNLPLITFQTDNNHVITDIRGSGLKNTGFTTEKLVGQPLTTLFPNARTQLEKFHCPEQKRFVVEGEYNNAPWFFDTHILCEKKNHSIHAGFAIDITEEKLTQSKLVVAEKISVLGLLVGGMAHEINNPLSYITNNTFMLQQYTSNMQGLVEKLSKKITFLDLKSITEVNNYKREFDWDFTLQETKNCLTENLNGLELIKNIVNDLRVYSQNEKNENKLQKVNVTEVIQRSVRVLSYKDKQRIRYEVTLISNCYMLGHLSRLHQVFINLLKNASEAIAREGIIKITSTLTEQHIIIKIWDNGCGIKPTIMKKLFTPFVSTKKYGEGTGLGLNITKTIITEHQGTITVQSEVGKFTEFTLIFPLFKEKTLVYSPPTSEVDCSEVIA